MNEMLVRKIRSAAITACIERGITKASDVRAILNKAHKGIGKMSVAGVNAAITKGQSVYVIEKLSCNCSGC